jgi:hypothetical protein
VAVLGGQFHDVPGEILYLVGISYKGVPGIEPKLPPDSVGESCFELVIGTGVLSPDENWHT